MDAKKIGLAVAGVVAAGVIAAGGAAVANSSSASTTSTTGSSQTSQMQPPGQSAQNGQSGQSAQGGQGGQGGPGGMLGTEVTGDEATKVKDAVAAQNSSVTVDHVLKQTDGSYLALTMQNNQPVIYQVSSDLATVTEQAAPTGALGGGMGGSAGGAMGGSGGTPPQQPNATATTN